MVDSWAFDSSERDLGRTMGANFFFEDPSKCRSDSGATLNSYYEEKTRWGDRYVLAEPPYYIRVFAQLPAPAEPKIPDRTWTGGYDLVVHLARRPTPELTGRHLVGHQYERG